MSHSRRHYNKAVNTIWRKMQFQGTRQRTEALMYDMQDLSEGYLLSEPLPILRTTFANFEKRFGQFLRRVRVEQAETIQAQAVGMRPPERARFLVPLRALRDALETLSNELKRSGRAKVADMPSTLIDNMTHLQAPVLVRYYNERDSRNGDFSELLVQPYVFYPTAGRNAQVFTLKFTTEFLQPIDDSASAVQALASGSGQQLQSVPTAAAQQTASTSSAPQQAAGSTGQTVHQTVPSGPLPSSVAGGSQAAAQRAPVATTRPTRIIRKPVFYGYDEEPVRPVRKGATQRRKPIRSQDSKKKETVKRRQPKTSGAAKSGKRTLATSGKGSQKTRKTTKR